MERLKTIEREIEKTIYASRIRASHRTGLSGRRDAPRNSVQMADFDILISLGSLYKERRRSGRISNVFRATTRRAFHFISFLFFLARTMRRKKKRHPSIVSPIIARLELIKKIPTDEIFIPSRMMDDPLWKIKMISILGESEGVIIVK